MLQCAQVQYLQYMVKDSGEVITTWCALVLDFLKNVGRDLATSVTFSRRTAPVGAQPPGSAAPGHGGQPRAPSTWFGFPPLAVLSRMLWELHPAVRTAESRREWGMLLLPINQRKADFIPCMWQNPDVNTALHVCSYLTSAFPGNFGNLKDSPFNLPRALLSPSQPHWQLLLSLAIPGCSQTSIQSHSTQSLHGHCQCHQPSTHP